MAGPRFVDWSHIRVVGDRHAAAAYVGEARKLMGYVQEDAARQGLGVHSLRRELSDGAVLIAEKHGAVPRMTIIPPPLPGARRPVPRLKDFTVRPGWGSGAEPLILDSGPAEDEVSWRTYFRDSDEPGYPNVPPEARGTYGGLFPNRLSAVMPCWENAEGETLGIFNTGSRYWPQTYHHPYVIYNTYVVHCGHIAFNTHTYQDDQGDRPWADTLFSVLGAAFRGGHLYVVMANLLPLQFDPPPATPSGDTDVWMSPAISGATHNYFLYRFAISPHTNPDTGLTHYRVVNGTAEQLAGFGSNGGLYAPWVFNEDVTEVVTYSMPRRAILSHRRAFPYNLSDAWPAAEWGEFAYEQCWRVSLEVRDETVTPATEAAGDRIAEHNGVALRLEGVGSGEFDYVCGDYRYPALRYGGVTNDPGSWSRVRRLIDCDISRGVFCFMEQTYEVVSRTQSSTWYPMAGIATRKNELVVVRNGVEEARDVYEDNQDGVVYNHEAFISAHEYISSFAPPAMSRFMLTAVSNQIRYNYSGAPNRVLRVVNGYMPQPMRQVRQVSNAVTRWSSTGGAAMANPATGTWETSYMGAGGELDRYNGTPPAVRLMNSSMAANDKAILCRDGAGVGHEPPVYGTGVGRDVDSLLGEPVGAAAFGLLGRPPKEQPMMVEAT